MDIQPVDIIIHIINIVVLFVILRVILYKPIVGFLLQRKEKVEADLNAAQQAKTEAEQLKLSYEEKLKKADEEAKKLVLAGNEEAGKTASAIIKAAENQAEELLVVAKNKAETQRKETISAMEGQITDLAVELAQQIIQREVSEKDNKKVIESFFDQAG